MTTLQTARHDYAEAIADKAVPCDRQDRDSGIYYHSASAQRDHDEAYNDACVAFELSLQMARAAYVVAKGDHVERVEQAIEAATDDEDMSSALYKAIKGNPPAEQQEAA